MLIYICLYFAYTWTPDEDIDFLYLWSPYLQAYWLSYRAGHLDYTDAVFCYLWLPHTFIDLCYLWSQYTNRYIFVVQSCQLAYILTSVKGVKFGNLWSPYIYIIVDYLWFLTLTLLNCIHPSHVYFDFGNVWSSLQRYKCMFLNDYL